MLAGRGKRAGIAGIAAIAAALVGVLAWSATRDEIPPVAAELRSFEEIELGELQGQQVRFGSGDGDVLPVLVGAEEQRDRSLALVDASSASVVDVGRLPVDGWAVDALAMASDGHVAVSTFVCSADPVLGDAGYECANELGPQDLPIELLVYDIEGRRWSSLGVGSAPSDWVTLVRVEGTTALLQRFGVEGNADAWAEVDLTAPSVPERYTSTMPEGLRWATPTPELLRGDGWTMTDPETSKVPLLWKGKVDGRAVVVEIPSGFSPVPAGRCVLLPSTMGSGELAHLHRQCAS